MQSLTRSVEPEFWRFDDALHTALCDVRANGGNRYKQILCATLFVHKVVQRFVVCGEIPKSRFILCREIHKGTEVQGKDLQGIGF
jgi:hypothetical protein